MREKTLKEIKNELSHHAIAKAFRNNSLQIANMTKNVLIKNDQQSRIDINKMFSIFNQAAMALMTKNNEIFNKWNTQLSYHHIDFEQFNPDENAEIYFDLMTNLTSYKIKLYNKTPINDVNTTLQKVIHDGEYFETIPLSYTDEGFNIKLKTASMYNDMTAKALNYLSNAIEIENTYIDVINDFEAEHQQN